MAAGNLTTVQRVKEWLSITNDASDDIIARLVSSASRFIYHYISLASVVVTDYSERYDGSRNPWLMPRQWPIISIASIQFSGLTISSQATGNPLAPIPGYTIRNFEAGPARITVHGAWFPECQKDGVLLNYTAGFLITDEEHAIASTGMPAVVTPLETDELWAADYAVTDSLGVPYVKVASNPTISQYAVSSLGVYTFNVADVGNTVLISYSYVPADLSQAATELIAGTFVEKSHIGVRSKTLGGQETISYWQNQITPHIALLLQPYIRIIPQ